MAKAGLILLTLTVIWQVDDVTADFIVSQLLFLDAEDPKKDIKLFINSPGGSVTAGMWIGLYNMLDFSVLSFLFHQSFFIFIFPLYISIYFEAYGSYIEIAVCKGLRIAKII